MSLPKFTPAVEPVVGAKKSIKPRLLVAEFGDGYTQSGPDGLNNIRQVWDLSWPYLHRADAQWIDDFLSARGGSEMFSYQIPAQRETTIRWTCEEWEYTVGPNGLDAITAKFKQSFNLDF